MAKFTNEQLDAFLDQDFKSIDLGDMTPRRYFGELLITLWDNGESFSGKRPFGNSGWESDLAIPAILSKAIAGEVEDGWAEDYDSDEYDLLVAAAINRLIEK